MDFLDKIIAKEVDNKVIPGMTYAIINAGETYIGAYGYKSLIPNIEKTNEDTIYDLASLTKVIITVTLISKMLENNLIDLNDSVKKHLPGFKYDDVTIFNLLTHTSGLPADIKSKDIIKKEEMEALIFTTEKEYETGTGLIYSDLGFYFLGKIIEKVYGKPLDVVAKKEIFEPLNMLDTSFNPEDIERCAPTEVTELRGIIKGTVHDEKSASLNGVSGHAGVFSTAKDLSNFALMVLNDGIYDGKVFLKKETIDSWFEPLVYDGIYEANRSWCWIVGINDLVINKNGNIISFNGFTGPSMSIDRDNNTAIVLMTNRVHPTRDNRKISIERPLITEQIYKELVYNNNYHF